MYSLDKRDRQSLFQRTSIAADPASSAAHVSLSSILQLSNNRRQMPSPKPAPNLSQEQQTSNPPIRLSFFRTRDFVASSAAALVSEWAYRTIPFSKSTA
ncbi:hypothetical protein, partial [Rhizobium bangladeshense]|uniref:hypothetical protein n=1 Tax=Rhizobium bangladeshense TaxID=1138189 RepID=UPI001C82A233